jgi:hypothetical protein
MSTVPDPDGATAVIVVSVEIVKEAAAVEPKYTAVTGAKCEPLMVTEVPANPLVGLMDVTTGLCST